MPALELSAKVFEHFDRIMSHLETHQSQDGPERIAGIIQALQILKDNPLIGRKVRGGKRELVIGRDRRGYVALYVFLAPIDKVLVLAIRSQREAGYLP